MSSSMQWVIEEEDPSNGVTTTIVFDFEEEEGSSRRGAPYRFERSECSSSKKSSGSRRKKRQAAKGLSVFGGALRGSSKSTLSSARPAWLSASVYGAQPDGEEDTIPSPTLRATPRSSHGNNTGTVVEHHRSSGSTTSSHQSARTRPNTKRAVYTLSPIQGVVNQGVVSSSTSAAPVAAAVGVGAGPSFPRNMSDSSNKKLRKKQLRRRQQEQLRSREDGASFSATVEALANRAHKKVHLMPDYDSDVNVHHCADGNDEDMVFMTAEHIDGHDGTGYLDAEQHEHECLVLEEHHQSQSLFSQNSSRLNNNNNTNNNSNNNNKPNGFSSYFISPIHQMVAQSESPWLQQPAKAGSSSSPSTTDANALQFQFLGQGGLRRAGGDAVGSSVNRARRRGRDDDHDNDNLTSSEDEAEALHRAKRRRLTQVNAECGGSLALGPLPSPSLAPPLTMLPTSKTDMREDLLSSFLMGAKLEEDDFKLF